MAADRRPTALIWCQHSVGLGHLVRTLAIADGLTDSFDVVVLNGGPLPNRTRVPLGVEIVNLPPLGHGDGYDLISREADVGVEEAQAERIRVILETLRRTDPVVVVVELFPFGRKKFAFELDPLLDAIHAMGDDRPQVVCSLRDILVNQRRDQARHDERASLRCNRDFDAVLVHADPAFCRLEDSFRPATPLQIPVHYTGFVAPDGADRIARDVVEPRMIVSAGGGMVGRPLFDAAIDVHHAVHQRAGLSTTIVAGPFLPADDWAAINVAAERSPHLTVVRQVDHLADEIACSTLSVSQCGYNTFLDLVRAGTPAVVVPYAEGKEDEQLRRARQLADLGLVQVAERPEAELLLDAITAAIDRHPAPAGLDIDGRRRTAAIVAELTGYAIGRHHLSHPTRPAPGALVP